MADPEAPEGATPELPATAGAAAPDAGAESTTEQDDAIPVESAPAAASVSAPGEPAEPEAAAVPDMSPAACGARLAELFPALFAAEGPRQPLKLRIQADIQARAPGLFSKRLLSVFLSRYTTTTAYLKALSTASQRIDLDGQPAGDIDAEHRQAAIDELTRRRALHEERRRAERQAQREAQRSARRADDAAAQQQRRAEGEAQRDRAALLRAFETSTLTKSNFCALKGLGEAELDARLALARQDRASRPIVAPVPTPPGGRGSDEPGRRGGGNRQTPRRPARPGRGDAGGRDPR